MDSDLNIDVNGEDSYRVEVSGWDAKENFFVEKTVWKIPWRLSAHSRATIRAISFLHLKKTTC